MEPERKQFLSRRLREAIAQQPELKKLVRELLKLGGEFVVAPPTLDPDTEALIRCGFVMAGSIVHKPHRVGACHQNVAAIWQVRRFKVVGIGTGYGLTGYGLWRQHSWGILREGILETTKPRMKYFGICLQGVSADKFSGVV